MAHLPSYEQAEPILKGKVCPYCGARTKLINRRIGRTNRSVKVYSCKPCKAWVGVHEGTKKSLGSLANHNLRQLRIKAHAALDQKWSRSKSSRKVGRNQVYEWLSDRMGIKRRHAHIGMFNAAQCLQVIAICEESELVQSFNFKNGESHE